MTPPRPGDPPTAGTDATSDAAPAAGGGQTAVARSHAIAGLPPPPGPFAWAVRWQGLLFLSGLRGIDPVTGRLGDSDEARVRLIFEHLARALEDGGSSLRHVLSTRVYVTDMRRHRPLVNDAFTRWFGAELPTRTIVEVRALNQDDTIEVEAIAACARDGDPRPPDGEGVRAHPP